MGLILWL